MNKKEAVILTGGLTRTSKMPCASYSLPTTACQTGYKMAQVAGSVCASCYANKGNYAKYASNIEPAQHARLESVRQAIENTDYRAAWIDAMSTLIGSSKYFRFHDSGDLQSVEHLELYADLADRMPGCKFWLPSREYGVVAAFTAVRDLPNNLIVRLSAMFAGRPVVIPASLRGLRNVAASNIHTDSPIGRECPAPRQGGACKSCRACWDPKNTISYRMH